MNRISSLILNRTFLAITVAVIAGVTASIQWGQVQQLLHTGTSIKASSQNKTFDYVVIGGGTAGLAIATRLAESLSHTVAVIEAGGFYEQDNGNLSTVPGYCTFFAGTDHDNFNPLVDWGFSTQPQKVHFPLKHFYRGSLTAFRRLQMIDAYTMLVVKPLGVHPPETSCTITGELMNRTSHPSANSRR